MQGGLPIFGYSTDTRSSVDT